MRGAAYACVRHALPLFPPLAIVAGIAIAELTARRSRAGLSLAGLAIVAAAVSAVPRIRPWEYYNEAFGGPGGAYRHFSDEGIDVGQRTKDLALYCRQQLEPRGIKPYVLYAISPQEEKRRQLVIRSTRSEEIDQSDDPVISGTLARSATSLAISVSALAKQPWIADNLLPLISRSVSVRVTVVSLCTSETIRLSLAPPSDLMPPASLTISTASLAAAMQPTR